ncbi:uncharacterized protein Dana_GF21703, isoform B [Drosophila ananassae]|uniref:Uncharacterized protein, isoform A n=1 Tax=Drosophila ananassae TaxID=7217 RepID=B3N0K9_DROAN|nr:glycerol-3-phosphate acyltransferase 3 [Drosophila ananassae]XP_014759449.1 glycerol-3-phosphate acyltransferase 3 [Drosophila ananassae]EDV38413.1 uncharacterized protein Dana_GF21703, isoform A [Drosophila ananassae]KPU77397.1 uncharacterized protein Dana_GF21703, isoform B [Drosophila ananassae]
MLFHLAIMVVASWFGFFWMQWLYLYLLERLFAWIAHQLEVTRQKRVREEMERLGLDFRFVKEQEDKDKEDKEEQELSLNGRKPFRRNYLDFRGGDGGDINDLLSPPIKNRFNCRMEQCCDVLSAGLSLVLEDEVTPRFVAAPAPAGEWNLLTRNLRQRKRYLNWQLRIAWLIGWIIRYVLMLPMRTIACWGCLLMISVVTAVLGQLPEWSFKRKLVELVLRQCFRITASCLPMIQRFHNVQNRPTMGICVCNHTSPLDVLVLMCDAHYSLTGQKHDGILGVLQRALSRVSPHMWFDRQELGDREALGLVLRLHGTNKDRPPILLFPEGTCINNTAVMQFKKGSFAVSDIVYPVAIRYDRRFGEAFWDSTRYSMLRYMLMVVSSWCICCDVWYMPALRRRVDETPVDFSNRVKAAIAAQANIEDLPWDGNLKRQAPVRDWQ